jgi:hypothetical protein
MQVKREVNFDCLVVDGDFAISRSHVNTGYRGLSSTEFIDHFHDLGD